MSNLYTQEVRDAVHKMPCPVPVTVHIVGYDNGLAIRIYQKEVEQRSMEEQITLMSYIYDLRDLIQSFDIVCAIQGIPIDVRGH